MLLSETVPWDDEQLPSHRPSIGKRILRTVVRFSFVFLIGAGTMKLKPDCRNAQRLSIFPGPGEAPP